MSVRLPSRSTDSGLGLPGPTNPCTAEITVSQPRTAAATAAGSRKSPVTISTPWGRCAPRPGSRVSTRTPPPRTDSSRTTWVPSAPVPPATKIITSPRHRRACDPAGMCADVAAGLFDRLEVEPHRSDDGARDAEDGHPAHQELASVLPGAGHVPLGPHSVAVLGRSRYPRRDVGNTREDLRPVRADLFLATKAPLWVCRGLVDEALGETGHQCLDVVRVHRPHQAVQYHTRALDRCAHGNPPNFVTLSCNRYVSMELINGPGQEQETLRLQRPPGPSPTQQGCGARRCPAQVPRGRVRRHYHRRDRPRGRRLCRDGLQGVRREVRAGPQHLRARAARTRINPRLRTLR